MWYPYRVFGECSSKPAANLRQKNSPPANAPLNRPAVPKSRLFKTRGRGGGRFGFQPRVKVGLTFDGKKTAGHSRVAKAAKLRAIDLVAANLRRHKPAWDPQAGNRVLTHAHGDDFQRMDHVLGTDIHDNRLADGNVNLIEHLNVVRAVRVGVINAKGVGRDDELHVLPAENSVRPGIARIPVVLFGDDLNHGGILRRRKFIHGLGPQRHGDENQKHGLDARDCEFDVSRGMVLDADVIGLWIARGAKTPDGVAEINDPADEQREHQPVDVNDEVINVLPVGRGQRRHSEQFEGQLFHFSDGFSGAAPLFANSSLRTMWTKKTAMHVSTLRMTPISVKIPQLMP